MDFNNLQKQDIKKSFTMDTTAQTQIYNSVFSDSLFTVNKQDNMEDRRTDFEKREERERRERERRLAEGGSR